MEKHYSFAGVEITVDIPDEKMFAEEWHLEPFRVESVLDPRVFRFKMVDALEAPSGEFVAAPPGCRIYREENREIRYLGQEHDSWEKAYIRTESRGREHTVKVLSSHFPQRISAKIVLNCLEAEHLVTEAGGFAFHSAFIEYEGKAILFTAPSGTGKSTQAELWRRLRGAQIINGDRSVIRCTNSGFYACGLPFAGSSEYYSNRTLPLAAVVYLAQAPETAIRPMVGYEAFSKLWEGCSINVWNSEDVHTVSDLVTQVAASVPIYYLSCTPDESAIIAVERILKKR